MRLTRPTHPARLRRASATRSFAAVARARRRERGKLLIEFCRTAVRALRAGPVAGTNQDFAVALALLAMKFVNRHKFRIVDSFENSRCPVISPSSS